MGPSTCKCDPLCTGVLVILSLHLFTPYFYYIPKASLAAVIIAAVVFMVEFHVVKPIWRTKSELSVRTPCTVVLLGCYGVARV